MSLKLLFLCGTVLYLTQTGSSQQSPKRLVCFYDAITGKYQEEPFFFAKKSLAQALTHCTHLVYSFAEIPPQAFKLQKFAIKPHPSELKKRFPHLKIFLSVGGGDRSAQTDQYMKFLQATDIHHVYFAKYVNTILKFHSFDGLDLAWPFPRTRPHKSLSQFESAVLKLKRVFSGNADLNVKANSLKLQYTKFVNVLRQQFSKSHLKLSMTVLPNVNSSFYFDIFKIQRNFEFINLFAFDFVTPSGSPSEADYTAPIYFKQDASRDDSSQSIDFQVNHWIHNGCPVHKLNLGIATYGRAWRLSIDSGLTGLPIVEKATGAAKPGKYSQIPGLLSWPEICLKLLAKGRLRKVVDKELKYGNYAFNPADKNNKNGTWISFDDPDFAGVKSDYVKDKSMGGVAIYNLQNDDFAKLCGGPAYPILSRISEVLAISH